MEGRAKRLRKYSGISLGVVLVMAFVMVQPTFQQASAVGVEGLPVFDGCDGFSIPEDPISMNSVRSGNIVKTIHVEKEVFSPCFLTQGQLDVVVDVTTYIEVYENIVDREIIKASAVVTTCLKEPARHFTGGATVIDCESYVPSTQPVPVGGGCEENNEITHPQEMNTVTKGKIAKTIEAQKEVFFCHLDNADKKVDVILFTDIYEDLASQEVEELQFHSMRCVTLVTDFPHQQQDARVETCQFSSIEN